VSGDTAALDRSTPSLELEEAEMSDKALAEAQQGIDRLFDRDHLKNEWIAPGGPAVIGELMDTSFPLRLVLPSNPELLAAWPGPGVEHQLEKEEQDRKRRNHDASARLSEGHSRSASRASIGNRGAMEWRLRSATVRAVTPKMLATLDGGVRMSGHGAKPPAAPAARVSDEADGDSLDEVEDDEETQVLPRPSLEAAQASSFTKRPKQYSKLPRESSGTETVVPSYGLRDSSQTPEPPMPNATHDTL